MFRALWIGAAVAVTGLSSAGIPQAAAQSPAALSEALGAASLVALAPGGNVPQLEVDVLSVVPENAYGAILGGDILETKAMLERVMRKLGIPYDDGDDYAEFTKFLESLRGWNAKATHAMAFVPGDDADDVELVVFVPVSNYKEFAAGLGADDDSGNPTKFKYPDGPDGCMAAKAGFAVLAEGSDEEVLKRVVGAKKYVSDVGPAMRTWIGKHQAAGLILPAGMAKIFDKIIEGIDEVKKQAENGPKEAAIVAGMFDVYSDLIKSGRDEITSFAMGARLDESSGLDWGMLASFRPDGKLAAAAKNIAPLPTQPLRGLPEGDYFVAGAGVVPEKLVKSVTDFSIGLPAKLPKNAGGYEMTPEEAKEMAEASAKAMEGVKSISMSMGMSGKNFFDRMYAVLKVDDSAQYIDNYEKSIQRLTEIVKKNPKSAFPAQSAEKKQIGGRTVIVVTSDLSAMFKQMEEQQQQTDAAKMMKQVLFGGDKLVAYVAAADKQTVVMTYNEEALTVLAEDVKNGKAGLADDIQIKAAQALLPAESHWVGYLSVGGYMEVVKKFMTAALGANGGGGAAAFLPLIPPFPDAPPVGFSARVNASSLEGHVVVPMGLAEAVRDYAMQLKNAFGGGLR